MGSENYINDQRDGEIRDQIDNSRSLLNPFAAGIGAIAIGAAVMSTKLAGGGRLISNLLHFLGHPRGLGVTVDEASNIGAAAAGSHTSGLRSVITANVNIKTGKLTLGPLDLISDVRSALEFTNSAPEQIGRRVTSRFNEYVNRKFANKVTASYFTHELDRITVGEVLSDQKNWSSLLGGEQWNVLKQGRLRGLIGDSNVIDTKLFKSPSGAIRDLRLSSIFTRPISVPGVNGPILERAGIFDMFGQGNAIAGLFGESRGFAVLASDRASVGTRLFIDGDVVTYRYGAQGRVTESTLASNRTLIKSGSPLLPINEAREGNLKLRINKRTSTIGKAISSFEEATGVGRSFSGRPSLIERYLIDPIRRYKALSDDSAVIFKHPHKYTSPFTNAADAVFGGTMPEAVFERGAIVPVAGGNREVAMADLKARDRLAVLFDLSDEYSVVQKDAFYRYEQGDFKLGNSHLVVPRRDKGIIHRPDRFTNTQLASNLSDVQQRSMNSLGIIDSTLKAKFTDVERSRLTKIPFINRAFPGLTSARTLANYSVARVSSLASESLLGIAFAPAKTLVGNLARLGAIPLIYDAGKEVVDYTDFLSEKYLGFSPIKAAASLYAGAREMQQSIRSVLGIQQAAKSAEDNFPGSVDSEGSFFARSLAAPLGALALLLGKGKFKTGAIAAAGIYAAIGGPNPGQTSEELKKEYLGETKVPVRKGRMWGLGYLPLFGGKPDYFDYSWYHKLQTDYQDKSMYGSREEYFSYHANVMGIPFPTPHNLFGIKNIMNPYRFEELHWKDRPYESTGSPLEQFPIIGPLLSSTLGKLMKPRMDRQMDMPLLRAGLVQKGLDPGTAKMLGMSNLEMSDAQVTDPDNILFKLNKLGNIATEPMGVYKFVMEFMGIDMGPGRTPAKATSDLATSDGRLFYDKQLGGMFNQTEFLRRFFLSDYSTPYRNLQLVNRVTNDMPSWLPGSNSEIEKDKSYFIDFGTGDPFTKLYNADARLPGKGYEALNALHSSQEGVYDDIDKFLILSDVAPYSQAYRKYNAIVSRSKLDPYWEKKVKDAQDQREQVVGVDKRYMRYSDTISDLNQATKDSAAYRLLRGGYDTFTHDFLAELPWVGSKLFPFRDPYEQYRKISVEGSEFASWNRPYSDIIKPMINDIASAGIGMAAIKGAGIGLALSGPMKWFNPIKNAGSLTVRGAVIGAGISTARILAGEDQDFIPNDTQQRSNTIEYMDAINYLKYRSLGAAASEQGSPIAGKLNRMTTRTLLGANSEIMIKSALPNSTDRRYFDYFAHVPEGQRAKIYGGVPDYMKSALDRVWSNHTYSRDEADQKAASILGEIPNQNWIGWNPDVTIAASKINLINYGINGVSDNYQRYGFYESQQNEILNRLPNLNDDDISYDTVPIGAQFSDILAIRNKEYISQFGGVSSSITSKSTSLRSNRRVQVKMDRRQDTLNSVNRYAR